MSMTYEEQCEYVKNKIDKIHPDSYLKKISGGLNDSLSLYDISDILIANTGRFCEHYLSDFLVTWNTFIDTLEKSKTKIATTKDFLFGIRQNGVDGLSYVMTRYEDHNFDNTFLDLYYRKLFAVRFIIDPTDEYNAVTIILVEL